MYFEYKLALISLLNSRLYSLLLLPFFTPKNLTLAFKDKIFHIQRDYKKNSQGAYLKRHINT